MEFGGTHKQTPSVCVTVPPAAVGVRRLRRPSNEIALSPRLTPTAFVLHSTLEVYKEISSG